jgi:hypothetical protein
MGLWNNGFVLNSDSKMFSSINQFHCSCDSTQGELEHRRVKRLYGKTNKNKAIRQIAVHERRETRLRRAREARERQKKMEEVNGHHVHQLRFSDNDPLPYTGVDMHHHISNSVNHPLDIFAFLRSFDLHDPATKVRSDNIEVGTAILT